MMEIRNPSTDEVIGTVAPDTEQSVAIKVAKAKQAQRAWVRRPLYERCAMVASFAQYLKDHNNVFAQALTRETGKPITQARDEIRGLDQRITFFLNNIAKVTSDQIVHQSDSLTEKITWEPLGIVANISAWNYPYFVGGNVFVPALLAGNGVIYKPSSYATLTGQNIAQALHASGIPEDIFVPIYGQGMGAALMNAPIDGVFFTGSNPVGEHISRAVAGRHIPVQLELGGKDPCYVREDADPVQAAIAVAGGAFYNTGQSCCAVERLYVHGSIYDAFVNQFLAVVQSFKLGDPMEEDTFLGPLTQRSGCKVLQGQIEDAIQKGATLRMGGKRMDQRGHFFEATVCTEVNHTMDIMREESFGPIIGIQKVTDDSEATALMNDTPYGLTASVYGKDRGAAEGLMAQLDAGTVYFNCCDRVSPRLPWSGRKGSGIGSTLSHLGIRAFVRPKAWHLKS